MRTVQMTLDDKLIQAVDTAAKRLNQSRSAFTREALTAALAKLRVEPMEEKHRKGYEKHPVRPGEFSDFEDEQVWVD
ncbi:MAG: ribbon-helix-helix domain-containing protein [Gammaproteobacteria bacterium]